MNLENEVKVVEGEVVSEVKKVETVVVSEAEKIKASILAQAADFKAQLEQVRKEMVKLQQDFDAKKAHALQLEGAIQANNLLTQSLTK